MSGSDEDNTGGFRGRSGAPHRDELLLSWSVMECQSDGVIAVGFEGTVMLFNATAATILGVNRDDVLRRRFGDVFLVTKRLDEFSQTILDAVSSKSVGAQRIVTVHSGGKAKSLSVITSYLVRSGDDQKKKLGVIGVIRDITETEELRKAAAEMDESLKAQNAKLQLAYRKIEESNAALESTAKKAQAARIFATGLVIVLFVAAGAYGWVIEPDDGHHTSDVIDENMTSSTDGHAVEALSIVTVQPTPVTSSISLTGRLTPWRKVNVTSPVAGKVSEVHFQYGRAVRKGDLLVDLDTSEIKRQHRDARRDYIKALKEVRTLQDWESSHEVSNARRTFTKAEVALNTQKYQLDTAAALLKQGIIPADQHKAEKRQYFSLQLDFKAAKENLEIVRAQMNEESWQMANLELDNARETMNALENNLKETQVRAPISGIVLDRGKNSAGGLGERGKELDGGQSVQEGELLLEIGDLQRLAVVTHVDEVYIPRIETGQPVRATGDAFPGLVLEGKISYVSSEASSAVSGGLPTFEVVGVLQELDTGQHGRLRLGMSVNMDIVTYHNPAGLMVPLSAVAMRKNRPWLRVMDENSGQYRDVQVETGTTTVDSVEVLRGIEPNDKVVMVAQ